MRVLNNVSAQVFGIDANPALGIGPVLDDPMIDVLAGHEVGGEATAGSRGNIDGSEIRSRQHRVVPAGADNSVFGAPSHRQWRLVQLEGPL